MKHIKKILCLMLAGSLLLLAACGNNNLGNENVKENPGEGRYIESDITPSIEGRFVSFIGADGTIVCYDDGLNTKYESADGGGSWKEAPGPGNGTDRYRNAQAGALLSDGSLIGFLQGEGLIIVSPDGSSKPYPVKEIDDAIASGENIRISLLKSLGPDRLLLGYSVGGMIMQSTQGARPVGGGTSSGNNSNNQTVPDGSLPGGAPSNAEPSQSDPQRSSGTTSNSMTTKTMLYDLHTMQLIADIPAENIIAAASDDDSFFLLDGSGKVTTYTLSDGKPSEEFAINFGGGEGDIGLSPISGGSSNLMALSAAGELYTTQNGSLMRADKNGAVSTVLESTAYSIGTPRSSAEAVLLLDDGSIVVNMFDSEQSNHLYKYVWDENATINSEKTLTVWSLEDNNFVRAAIAELRKKHTDSTITYEVALDGGTAVSAADAIKTLNTQLISGNGPDIILLDGCSVDSYVDKGMLLELNSLIDIGDIFDSLISPYMENNTLYCLPTQFLMPILMAEQSNLAQARTLDELLALVENGNDLPTGISSDSDPFSSVSEDQRAALYFENLKELCDILWMSSGPAIVQDNRLNVDALHSYLYAVKTISDKYGLTETSQNGGGLKVGFSDGGSATAVPGSLTRCIMQHTNYAAFSAGHLSLLQMVMDREEASLALFPGLTPGAWQPSTVVGVNVDTDIPEFAAEFIQTMLSDTVQQLNYGIGLPVTRAGIGAQLNTINDRRAQNGQEPFTAFDPDALIGQLISPSMGDTVLTEMMWSTIEKCCKGQIDVEGAVREIEQNIKNYLAERS